MSLSCFLGSFSRFIQLLFHYISFSDSFCCIVLFSVYFFILFDYHVIRFVYKMVTWGWIINNYVARISFFFYFVFIVNRILLQLNLAFWNLWLNSYFRHTGSESSAGKHLSWLSRVRILGDDQYYRMARVTEGVAR